VTRFAVILCLATAAAAGGALALVLEPDWYLRMRYPLRYEHIVRGHAANYGLDPAVVAAVIYQESKFRADARSRSGAIGLMQLLPRTAEGIATRTGGSEFRVADLYEPEINVRYGCWYLQSLLRKYGALETALAAYNGGQGNVDRGVQFEETRTYVRKVLELRDIYAQAYGL
jgi:peptidoglycan lytic transglycosylase